jgi:hypothetical protein
MPRLAGSWTSGGGARTALLVLACGLGVAALCLLVFGTSQRQLQLGVLLGLWAGLIAACLQVFGRAEQPEAEPARELAEARAVELHEAQLEVVARQQEQLEAARQAYFSSELELRRFSEQQLTREAGARQDSEHRLQAALGREVERVLLEQLGSLREEVAALRAEVVEKLGGQLRLERIETTRVIGSDLEALQHEIRRLAAASTEGIAAPVRAAAPSSRPEHQGSRDIVDAELVEFPPPATELPVVPATRTGQPATRTGQPATRPADPFAELPRLSPLQADLDLIPDSPPAAGTDEQRAGRRRAPEPERLADDPRYQGRRRADGSPADRFASLES